MAEYVYAIVLEILLCQVYVLEQALPGVAGSVGATEQAESLEVTCYVLGRDMRWYAFLPPGTKERVKGFHTATELYYGRLELPCKVGKPVAVHIVCFEPDGVYTLVLYHFPYLGYGFAVQFHGRTGVDDVQHAVFAGDLLQHLLVDVVWCGGNVATIIAEGTLSPLATGALQEEELSWEVAPDDGIPVHAPLLL